MELSAFLDVIENLTGSPVRIKKRKDIPAVIDKIDINEDDYNKIEIEELQKFYLLDEKVNKYRLKPNLTLKEKTEILTLFDNKNKNNPTIEESLIETIITDDNRLYDCNQFNELLLLCNKDRINHGFFDFFIRQREAKNEKINLSEICEGIEYFRKYALLVYGNFKFAYRSLSNKTSLQIRNKISEYLKEPKDIKDRLCARLPTIEKIEEVAPKDTYLLGYLSGAENKADTETSKAIGKFINATLVNAGWDAFILKLNEYLEGASDISEDIKRKIRKLISNFEDFCSKDVDEFRTFINYSTTEINNFLKERKSVLKKGIKNTQIYLTWDHMDVYLATSMRTKWEFEELCKLIDEVFKKNDDFNKLKLRYFNPIQSYEDSNIDKGLIEGLMLKRAKCTLYSVQETDTLGKDSELASTLAQGKPVIAYIRKIANVEERAKELEQMPLDFFYDRHNVLIKEGCFTKNQTIIKEYESWLEGNNLKLSGKIVSIFVDEFTLKITRLIDSKVWSSIKTPWADDDKFKKESAEDFSKYCYFIATAEKYFYDKRADSLTRTHPLRIQIHLSTGVANGVLVVRTYEQCIQLLTKIITNQLYYDLDFEFKHNNENRCWVLNEKISGCAYRVVTDSFRLTNSFWNFYLVEEEGEHEEKNCRVK